MVTCQPRPPNSLGPHPGIPARRPRFGASPGRQADLPEGLLERFGERRFIPLDDPAPIDHVGDEIVLIGAARDAEQELGITLDAAAEDLETADLLRRIGVRPDDLPVEPLVEGKPR